MPMRSGSERTAAAVVSAVRWSVHNTSQALRRSVPVVVAGVQQPGVTHGAGRQPCQRAPARRPEVDVLGGEQPVPRVSAGVVDDLGIVAAADAHDVAQLVVVLGAHGHDLFEALGVRWHAPSSERGRRNLTAGTNPADAAPRSGCKKIGVRFGYSSRWQRRPKGPPIGRA